MKQVIIRPVTRDDFDAWKLLWDGYNAFYGRQGPTALADEITRMTWSRFFDVYEPVHALVVEEAGNVIGLVHYLFHRSTIQIAPTCYLQDLFTSESARGKGIGRLLIEALYERAKEAGSGRNTGKLTRPIAWPCSFTTRSRKNPGSWFTASCCEQSPHVLKVGCRILRSNGVVRWRRARAASNHSNHARKQHAEVRD